MSARRAQFYFVQSLTLGRIPLILLFLGVNLAMRSPVGATWFAVAFGAMILAAVTDLFDGYFARRFRVTTRLGAYADPLTDKVYYLTAFPVLIYLAAAHGETAHAKLLLALAVLFLLRDQWVTFLRSIGALHQVDAKANWSGKWRTIISFPVLCLIYYFLEAPQGWRLQIAPWVVYTLEVAMLAINLVSIYVYTVYYWPWVREEMRLPGESA